MEFFPDGTHVRLRTSNGKYLHALDDGLRVGVRRRRESLNAAWAVEHAVRRGRTHVHLRTASYGSYLSLRCKNAASATRRICQAVLQLYDDPRERDSILWEVELLDQATRRIQLRHCRFGLWYTPGNEDRSRSWVAEAIPQRLYAPELPLAVQPEMQRVGRRTYAARVEYQRTIRYTRADLNGNIVERWWRKFSFEGTSVSLLRDTLLARRLGEEQSDNIMLCVRAGKHGLWNPLVVDLPKNEETVVIVILTTGSAGAARLRHPNVDALGAPPAAAAGVAAAQKS